MVLRYLLANEESDERIHQWDDNLFESISLRVEQNSFKKSVVSSRAEEKIQCAYQVAQCSLDSRVCGGENCNPTD